MWPAEQDAQEAPAAISQFTQEVVRSVVPLGGFAGALLVVWPQMTLLLLASVVTAVFARLATARREASTEEAWVATDRRRLFYRPLLTDVRAAREIRLLGRPQDSRQPGLADCKDVVGAVRGAPARRDPAQPRRVPAARPCDRQHRVPPGKPAAGQRVVQGAAGTPGAACQFVIGQTARQTQLVQVDAELCPAP